MMSNNMMMAIDLQRLYRMLLIRNYKVGSVSQPWSNMYVVRLTRGPFTDPRLVLSGMPVDIVLLNPIPALETAK